MPAESLVLRYRDQLLRLLPPGIALTRLLGSHVSKWAEAFAVEFARAHERVDDMVREAWPGSSTELLTDWETLTGLPDECTATLTTDAQRQGAVLDKFAEDNGQAEDDLIAIGAARGYALTIELWDTFRTGVHTIGHMPMYSTEWYYALNISYTPQTPEDDEALECKLRDHMHSHVVLHFNLTVGPPDYFMAHPRS